MAVNLLSCLHRLWMHTLMAVMVNSLSESCRWIERSIGWIKGDCRLAVYLAAICSMDHTLSRLPLCMLLSFPCIPIQSFRGKLHGQI